MYNVTLCSLNTLYNDQSALSPPPLLRRRLAPSLLLVALLFGCSESSSPPPTSPTLGPKPETVSIQGGQLTAGLAGGTLREAKSLAPFSIQKFPTTVAQYKACVDAGVCQLPDHEHGPCAPSDHMPSSSFFLPNSDSTPVTCVSPPQAQAFCSWVGGDLPSPEQWQLAARGPSVARFPWGDDPRQCLLQPSQDARKRLFCCDGPECADPSYYSIGLRPTIASPFGLQDLLTLRGELVRTSPDSQFYVCSLPDQFCLFSGKEPAAIDYLSPVRKDELPGLSSFRCVFKG